MTDLDWKWFELCMGELLGLVVIGFLGLHWHGQLLNAKKHIRALQGFQVDTPKGTSGTGPGGCKCKCHIDMLGGPGA
jgi:hypothetical protein